MLQRRRERRRLRKARSSVPEWELVERLHESQSLESDVLLPAAEHYANAVEQVSGEEEGRAVCHAIGLGFALRRVEEAEGAAAPLPDSLVRPTIGDPAAAIADDAARLTAPLDLRLEDEPGVLAELFAPGFDAWRDLSRRCRRAAAAASLRRRRAQLELGGQAAGREIAPALVDYERALRFGYVVACLEAVTVRPPPPPAPADLLERVDELLACGAALYGVRDTEVALVVGVVHGLGLEAAPAGDKDGVISAARAGFALRAAEEAAGLAESKLPELTDCLAVAESRDPALLRWDAAQALAWELVDGEDELPRPAGHEAVKGQLVAALDGDDPAISERACRFGYALRCAEGSLPHDPSRPLREA